ncbi:MAG TPA: NAD(P)H-dependent oxidoreductase [Acidimicrobiales bacterium]|nr:NAD(P)H-dependent oxidoreductase [Acidimicrobiales bacterium]
MLKLKILLGSTRPTRSADLVAPWVLERAGGHGAFDVEVLDLRDWALPMFQEHLGTIGDFNDPTYSDPVVREWNRTLKGADALLVVTPEYLHSIPGVLKNALDSVFVSYALRNKPLAAVGYSSGTAAGVRAVEHLMHVGIESEMVPLRDTVVIPHVATAFDAHGGPVDSMTDIAMTVMLDDLAWWGALLAHGRAQGELIPGSFRMRAAMAAIQEAS